MPSTRLGSANFTEADRLLAKALSHPVRTEALMILNTRVASPTEIAAELELPVGNVAYHVGALAKYGCVELVSTKQRRGGTEHFYRGVAQKYLSERFFEKLSYAVRHSISMTGIRVLIGAIRDSAAAGLLDKRTDRNISVMTYNLDGQGWEEAKQLYLDTLNRTIEIGAAAEGRIAAGKAQGKGLRATFGLQAFESPAGSPSAHELGDSPPD